MNKDKKTIRQKNEQIRQLNNKIDLLESKIDLLETKLEYYRELALVDNLTKLYNRRALIENKGYNSVIFADIDHFKEINDKYGHDAGDKILVELGDFFRSNIRETDCAIRYGGDEFLILLKNCPVNEAFEKAKQLRENLSKFNQEFNHNITMSFGVSNLSDKTLEESIKEADSAMYESKDAGRDTITLYELK